MSTKAGTGAGALLKIFTTGTTYVPISQLKTFQFTGAKWTLDDITNASSPAVGVGILKEVQPSVVDYGEVNCSGVWLYSDTGQQQLMTDFNAGAAVAFKLLLAPCEGQLTTGNEYDFTAYVTDLPAPDISFDKALTFKATLKVNSLFTITPGA